MNQDRALLLTDEQWGKLEEVLNEARPGQISMWQDAEDTLYVDVSGDESVYSINTRGLSQAVT